VDEVTARKRRFIASVLVGGLTVSTFSIELTAIGFPNASAGGRVFVPVLIASFLLMLISLGARAFVKAPRKLRVTAPVMFFAVSRLSFLFGWICLLVLALASLLVDRGIVPLLLRAFVSSLLISAFWSVLTTTIINFALLSKRFRDSVTPVE
jgi:hypothetical protein